MITLTQNPPAPGEPATAALRERAELAESQYRVLLDAANTVIICFTPERIITQWNREAERVFGWTHDEAVGRDCSELAGLPGDREALDGRIAGVLAGQPAWSYVVRKRARDGSIRVLLSNLTRADTICRASPVIVAIAQDITERARDEERLRASEAALNQAQRLAQLGSWTWNVETDVVTWSEELYRIAGRSPQSGAPSFAEQEALYSPATWPRLCQAVERCLTAGIGWEEEVEMLRPDGEARTVITRGEPLGDGSGRITRVHGTAQDVTESRVQLRQLRESEERFRLMAATISDVFWMRSPVLGDLRYISPGYESLWGRSCESVYASPLSFLDAIHPEDRARVEAVMRAHPPSAFALEYRVVRPDGSIRWVRDRAFPIRDEHGEIALLTGAAADITELQERREQHERAEQQLRSIQRLEAVGRLAGGVAHDFNNLLVAINGYADFAIESLRDGDPVKADLQQIRKAGERAAGLTRQLLAFSRKQVLKPEAFSLNDLVRGMEDMLARLIGEDISLQTVLDPDLADILADRGQIEQVLMNLVVNARDAMPTGGTVVIETAERILPRAPAESGCLMGSTCVVVTVSDTGCGMDESTRAAIFEPFFTTKPAGQGTGLGLAMVYGIVKQSGGTIAVDTAPGEGTTFTIAFPVHRSAALPDAAAVHAPVAARAHETVLVVEDEPAVRELTRRILAKAGYEVLTAASGPEAERVVREHDGAIQLLITDVVMPQMSGRELGDRLAATHPALRVIYMSGYSGSAIAQHGVVDDHTTLIGKPFTAAELTRRAREVLDGVS
jgi:PAS domain S-box-containing protein